MVQVITIPQPQACNPKTPLLHTPKPLQKPLFRLLAVSFTERCGMQPVCVCCLDMPQNTCHLRPSCPV